jgi:chromosomal replication initiation ATPase DnaA
MLISNENLFQVIDIVCDELGYTRKDFFTKRKDQPLATARHFSFWLMYQLGVKNSKISDFFFRNDYRAPHSTIIHGVNKITQMRRAKHIEDFTNRIYKKCLTHQMNCGNKPYQVQEQESSVAVI